MREHIKSRVLDMANRVISSGKTLRQLEKETGWSKSTIHKDLQVRLPKINPTLYLNAAEVLRKNLEERHMRGGMATKRKWAVRRRGT